MRQTVVYTMCSNHLKGNTFQHILYSVAMTATDPLCCFRVNNMDVHYIYLYGVNVCKQEAELPAFLHCYIFTIHYATKKIHLIAIVV